MSAFMISLTRVYCEVVDYKLTVDDGANWEILIQPDYVVSANAIESGGKEYTEITMINSNKPILVKESFEEVKEKLSLRILF